MRRFVRRSLAGAGGALLAAGTAAALALGDPLPRSTLAVAVEGAAPWWQSSRAPRTWRAPLRAVTDAIQWRDDADGVTWGELSLRGTGEARRTRVIVVLVDPRRVTLRLVLPALDTSPEGWLAPQRWSIASAPETARMAMNAGQFTSGGAWGWLVQDGHEVQQPRLAPLAPAVVVDSAGAVQVVRAAAIDSVRRARQIAQAFQSYPTLLDLGRVPGPLQRAGLGLDVAHRDSRLALGTLADGRIIVALTRFEGLGGALDRLPFGLTAPEMAAVMGALGARDAVLLDGGISGQLLVRDGHGEVHRWPGMRRVPLGLVIAGR